MKTKSQIIAEQEQQIILVEDKGRFYFKDFKTTMDLKVPEVKEERNIIPIIEEHNKLSKTKWVLMGVIKK